MLRDATTVKPMGQDAPQSEPIPPKRVNPGRTPLTSGTNRTVTPAQPTAQPKAPTMAPTGAPTAVPGGTVNPIPATPATPAVPANPGLTAVATPQPVLQYAPPQSTSTSGGAVNLTPTDPNNPLTGQTITPGDMADRFAIAQQRWQQYVDSTGPQYQAALRDANRMGAAAGGLGSGQLRTSLGDLAAQRGQSLDLAGRGFLTDALEGSIGDAWNSIGLAERQQGFHQGQQDRAFGNEVTRLQMEEALRSGDFNRALQLWMAGQQGGTGSDTLLGGAGQAGDNAAGGTNALYEWMRQRAQVPGAPATGGSPADWMF